MKIMANENRKCAIMDAIMKIMKKMSNEMAMASAEVKIISAN